MVASVSRILGRSGHPSHERCVSVKEALDLGTPYETIPASLIPLRNSSVDKPTFDEYLAANVRIADESITISSTTCTSGEELSHEVVPIVVECPVDPAQRCAGCILNLASGEDIRRSMELNALYIAIN